MSFTSNLAVIASRHRGGSQTQPAILDSKLWVQDVNAGKQPASRSWTVPPGTDVLLCVAAAQLWNSGSCGVPSWAGSAMSAVDSHKVGNHETVNAWILANPQSGSGGLTFSPFNFQLSGCFHPCLIALKNASVSGVKVFKGGATNRAGSIATSAAPDTATDILIDVACRTDNTPMSAGSGQTFLHEGGYRSRGGVSYRLPTSTANLAFSWSWTVGNEDVAHMIIKIAGK